jgi:hypothetical protein
VRILFWVFFAMACYGMATEHKGAGMLAAGCAVFMIYASRHYERQDREWLRDPRHAKVPDATGDVLKKHDCEHS